MTGRKVQTLLQVLQAKGLEHWHDVVLDFAARFDGWRAHYLADETLSPDFLPFEQVIAAVQSLPNVQQVSDITSMHPVKPYSWQDLALANALATTEMTGWHSRYLDGYPNVWNPLNSAFLAFHRPGTKVQTWLDDKSMWTPSVIRSWLLGRLAEHQARSGPGHFDVPQPPRRDQH